MTDTQARTNESLSTTAVRGSLWVYLSFLSGKGLTFASTVILARFLTPEHFGIVALTLLAVQYLDVLTSFGMGSAIIARRDRLTEAANAAFIVSMIMGVALFALAWLAAPLIAGFFGESDVTSLLRTLALVLPFASLGVVPSSMLERELRFRTRLIPDISRNLIKGVLAVTLAWQGFGPWSIIWAHVLGDLVASVLLVWLSGWRPSVSFDRAVTREMIWYGWHSMSVGLLAGFKNQIDYVLVGRILGTQALGFYTLAFRIPDLILRNINTSVGRVTMPILSRAQGDLERMSVMYSAYLRYTALIILPAGLGLALASPLLIELFFTPEWKPAVVVMQWISVAVAIGSVGHAPGVLYRSMNRPDILNKLVFFKALFALVVLWYCTRWGIVGVAAAQVPVSTFAILLDTFVIWRVLGFHWTTFFRAVGPPVLGSAFMVAVLWVSMGAISMTGVIGLAAMVSIGVASYGAILMVISRETIMQMVAVSRSLVRRAPAPVS